MQSPDNHEPIEWPFPRPNHLVVWADIEPDYEIRMAETLPVAAQCHAAYLEEI